MAKRLTAKKLRFVDEYLIDCNSTQAAIRAGFSKRTARAQGHDLLSDPDVERAICEAMAARSERTEVDADYVVRRLVAIDQMDVLDIMNDDMGLKPVSQWPKVWRQYLSGFEVAEMFEGRGEERDIAGMLKKIRWPDKVKNLELLGRHLGVFKDGGGGREKPARNLNDFYADLDDSATDP